MTALPTISSWRILQSPTAFHSGMTGAREKQWASTRITTWEEDIAHSLFGIFGVHLPIIYDKK
jgi:hypothetical protein